VTDHRPLDLESIQTRAAVLAAIPVPRRTPMLHETWLRACALALDPSGSFEVITVGDPDSPDAGAAFVARGAGPNRRLVLLGAEDLWEPGDLFYRDSDAAASLARRLIDRRMPFRFGHFAADSPVLDALKEAGRGRAFIVADAVAGSPVLALDESWQEPEKKFSSRGQRDLRRKRRKAEALGAVTFAVVEPAVDDVGPLLEEAMAVEAASWKGRSGTALAHDETLRTFFATYAGLASEAGILRFSFLRIDGRAIAVQIGVVSDGAEWQLKIGYDEQYRECSPGILLMLEIVRHAAGLGLERFEFLGKAAPWTRQWTEQERPNVRLRVYPYSARGGSTLVADAARMVPRRARALVGGRREPTPE
jgi:CelD/BcsL family acetyltransferase involved in cellulose biosynthesis